MSSKLAVVFFLAFVAIQLSTLGRAAAEVTTIKEFLAGESESTVSPAPASPDRGPAPPAVYVVVEGNRKGDSACRMDFTAEATVGSVLRQAYYPQPINFDTATITVHRARQLVNVDLSVEAVKEILRIEWDANANEPTAKSNHRLQPGDRVVVTLPGPAGDALKADFPATMIAAPLGPELEISGIGAPRLLPSAKPVVRYSAMPAAVPSPFSTDPIDSIPPFAAAARDKPLDTGDVIPVLATELEPAMLAKVRFDIAVVEDLDNSFAEFSELRTPMPFMLADSSTMRGTLRILEKHEHVRRIAVPKLMAVAGERAQFSINTPIATRKESGRDADFQQALAVEVSARELGGGLAVEFQLRSSSKGNVNTVATSLIVPHGQTVVMKTGDSQAPNEDGDAKNDQESHAVYVVLTPELVKLR